MSITFQVGLDLAGHPLGDLRSEVEDHDLVRDVHHEGHVVLHNEDGDVPCSRIRGDELRRETQVSRMLRPAGRLIQEV